MKFSRFNSFQPYGENILGYNAYNDKYLILDKMLFDMLQSAAVHGIDAIRDVHVDFADALVENGFILSEEINEIERVRSLINKIDANEEIYHLIINPTMNCNFKCWYCYETHIKDSKMDMATIDKIIDHIGKYLIDNEQIKNLHLSFFGGEPLLYFDSVVEPLLTKAKKIAHICGVQLESSFTSNGFLIRQNMIAKFRDLNVKSFQITLDGNRENHDKVRFVNAHRGSYNEIIANILLLAEEEIFTTVRLNYTTENIHNIDEILENLCHIKKKEFIAVSFHQVWQDTDNNLRDIVNSKMQIIKKAGFVAKHSILTDTVRNSCYADRQNHATINYNGDIFKCTARDFKVENKEGDLLTNGSIKWADRHAKRMEIKLQNKPCLECSILPICGGGCSQLALENQGKDYCVNDFDEDKKKQIVLDRFLEVYQ